MQGTLDYFMYGIQNTSVVSCLLWKNILINRKFVQNVQNSIFNDAWRCINELRLHHCYRMITHIHYFVGMFCRTVGESSSLQYIIASRANIFIRVSSVIWQRENKLPRCPILSAVSYIFAQRFPSRYGDSSRPVRCRYSMHAITDQSLYTHGVCHTDE